MAYAMHVYPDLPVSRLYLAGGGAALKGLPELLASEIGIEVKRIDPLAALDPNRSAAAQECGPAWTKAVGLALLNRK